MPLAVPDLCKSSLQSFAAAQREDSALHYAAAFSHDDVLELLLDRGAPVNVRGEVCHECAAHEWPGERY